MAARWVILDRVACRTDDESLAIAAGGGVRLELASPPTITFIEFLPAVPRRTGTPGAGPRGRTARSDDGFAVAVERDLATPFAVPIRPGTPAPEPGGRTAPSDDGFAVAVERDLATPFEASPDASLVVVAADRDAGLLLAFSAHEMKPLGVAGPGTVLYVLREQLDKGAAVLTKVRLHPISHLGNLGIMSIPDRDGWLLAELHHDSGNARAVIMATMGSEIAGDWVAKDVAYPEELTHRSWRGHGSFSYGGRLWWVDISQDLLLSCDPNADDPSLAMERLPRRSAVVAAGTHEVWQACQRCVNVSDGYIRCAEVSGDGVVQELKILMWTRTAGTDGRHEWKDGIICPLPGLCRVPRIVLVDPLVSQVVYLCVEDNLIEFDAKRGKLIRIQEAAAARMELVSWNLPSVLSSDLYPRVSGTMIMPGWDKLEIVQNSSSDMLVEATPVKSNTTLRLRLWNRFLIKELCVHMIDADTCRVQFRLSRRDRQVSAVLPSDHCLIRVPVPDFETIFRAAGVRFEEVEAPGDAVFRKGEIYRGCYIGDQWRVDFIEVAAREGRPILLLRFKSSDGRPFDAQLLCWPKFHMVHITKQELRQDRFSYDIMFVAKRGARPQYVKDVYTAVRMIPLPCLSRIREAFSSAGTGDQ